MSVTAEQLQRSFDELVRERTGSDAQSQALIYEDLKRIAHRVSGRVNTGETLQTTALLHEAWLQLKGADTSGVEDRQRFMALAATIMHRIAVDHIRERVALKRGGDAPHVSFDEAWQSAADGEPDGLILRLHEGLEELKAFAVKIRQTHSSSLSRLSVKGPDLRNPSRYAFNNSSMPSTISRCFVRVSL